MRLGHVLSRVCTPGSLTVSEAFRVILGHCPEFRMCVPFVRVSACECDAPAENTRFDFVRSRVSNPDRIKKDERDVIPLVAEGPCRKCKMQQETRIELHTGVPTILGVEGPHIPPPNRADGHQPAAKHVYADTGTQLRVHALIYHHDDHFVVWLPDAAAEPIEWPHEHSRVTAVVVSPTGEPACSRRWAPQRTLPDLIGTPELLPTTANGDVFVPTVQLPDIHDSLYSAPQARIPQQPTLQVAARQQNAILMSEEEVRYADNIFGAEVWRMPAKARFVQAWLDERRRSETLARQTAAVGQASEAARHANAQLGELKCEKAELEAEVRELDAKLVQSEAAFQAAAEQGAA
jgi:hypothetical protein